MGTVIFLIVLMLVIMTLLGWIVASIADLRKEAETHTFFLRFLVGHEENEKNKEIDKLKKELEEMKEEKEADEANKYYDNDCEGGCGDVEYDYE